MRHFIAIVALIAVLAPFAEAKRAAPPKVAPVVHEGVRYLAPNDNGRQGMIQAWDEETNQKSWEIIVFKTAIDPKLEEDVQWVFIQRLAIDGGKLIVVTEDAHAYSVDLKTRAVEKLKQVPAEKAK